MPVVPVTRLPFTLTATSVLAVIPARFASSRLPGKALVEINGRPMIAHVYERAQAARSLDAVLVATDDERIAEAVDRFGGTVCLTSARHRSGTDRLAEVAAATACGVLVNVQGDEPLLDPAVIDAVVAPMRADATIEMATAARPLGDVAELTSPHMVKVVSGDDGCALYFSRAPIPYRADGVPQPSDRIHVGLYGYRRETLLRLAALPPSPLERLESLEQLRALEHGIRIRVVDTPYISHEVNTPDDLARVRLAAAPLR